VESRNTGIQIRVDQPDEGSGYSDLRICLKTENVELTSVHIGEIEKFLAIDPPHPRALVLVANARVVGEAEGV